MQVWSRTFHPRLKYSLCDLLLQGAYSKVTSGAIVHNLVSKMTDFFASVAIGKGVVQLVVVSLLADKDQVASYAIIVRADIQPLVRAGSKMFRLMFAATTLHVAEVLLTMSSKVVERSLVGKLVLT